jgi:hypothetical protein
MLDTAHYGLSNFVIKVIIFLQMNIARLGELGEPG